MAEHSWWRRALATLEREYERRIRRASLVGEYGAAHGEHEADATQSASEGEDPQRSPGEPEDGEVAAIVNLPRGAAGGWRSRVEAPPEAGDQQP